MNNSANYKQLNSELCQKTQDLKQKLGAANVNNSNLIAELRSSHIQNSILKNELAKSREQYQRLRNTIVEVIQQNSNGLNRLIAEVTGGVVQSISNPEKRNSIARVQPTVVLANRTQPSTTPESVPTAAVIPRNSLQAATPTTPLQTTNHTSMLPSRTDALSPFVDNSSDSDPSVHSRNDNDTDASDEEGTDDSFGNRESNAEPYNEQHQYELDTIREDTNENYVSDVASASNNTTMSTLTSYIENKENSFERSSLTPLRKDDSSISRTHLSITPLGPSRALHSFDSNSGNPFIVTRRGKGKPNTFSQKDSITSKSPNNEEIERSGSTLANLTMMTGAISSTPYNLRKSNRHSTVLAAHAESASADATIIGTAELTPLPERRHSSRITLTPHPTSTPPIAARRPKRMAAPSSLVEPNLYIKLRNPQTKVKKRKATKKAAI